jgi:hypothetical protein
MNQIFISHYMYGTDNLKYIYNIENKAKIGDINTPLIADHLL